VYDETAYTGGIYPSPLRTGRCEPDTNSLLANTQHHKPTISQAWFETCWFSGLFFLLPMLTYLELLCYQRFLFKQKIHHIKLMHTGFLILCFILTVIVFIRFLTFIKKLNVTSQNMRDDLRYSRLIFLVGTGAVLLLEIGNLMVTFLSLSDAKAISMIALFNACTFLARELFVCYKVFKPTTFMQTCREHRQLAANRKKELGYACLALTLTIGCAGTKIGIEYYPQLKTEQFFKQHNLKTDMMTLAGFLIYFGIKFYFSYKNTLIVKQLESITNVDTRKSSYG
jgi:hypothetical protein